MLKLSFLKKYKKKFKRLIFKEKDFPIFFCKGKGLEVGAMDCPYQFPTDCKVDYADIYDDKKLEKILNKIPGNRFYKNKIVNPKYILKPNKYEFDEIFDSEYDFVFSSHSLEHSPNPVNSLVEQIRIIKPNGIVYCIIPNKNYTYDRLRRTTDSKVLIEKYESKNFDITEEEALDVIRNTDNHELYKIHNNRVLEFAKEIIEKKEGIHHFYTFDEINTIEILNYLVLKKKVLIKFFSADYNKDIHFALKKI